MELHFIIVEFRIYRILIYWFVSINAWQNIVTKVKCLLDGLSSRMEGTGINKLEYGTVEITQSEQ